MIGRLSPVQIVPLAKFACSRMRVGASRFGSVIFYLTVISIRMTEHFTITARKLSTFLYKFQIFICKGLIQSEVFISKIKCQAPVGLLQVVGTLIWKRIEVLDIGNGQRLLPASTESISSTCSV